MNGCGYKAAPYYMDEAPKGDKNVKFIINKKEFKVNDEKDENSTSCE